MNLSSRRLAFLGTICATSVLLASGCSSKPVRDEGDKTDPAREYALEKERLESTKIIAPGFVLRIQHSADESISGEYKVTFKGEIRLPYLKGRLMAAGRTTDELENDLERAYRGFFKSGNSVKVSISTRNYLVEVRGLVKEPGIYSLKLDTSIEETIAKAGGLTSIVGDGQSGPKAEYLRIVRRDFRNKNVAPKVIWVRLTDYFLKYDIKNEVLWRGGEQLFFQVTGDKTATRSKSQTVQIMGEVKVPGEYALQPEASLHSYLAKAGGVTSGADLRNVTVIRASTNDSTDYNISNSTATVSLEPGDVILVKAINNRPGFFERFGPLFISLGSLALSALIALATL